MGGPAPGLMRVGRLFGAAAVLAAAPAWAGDARFSAEAIDKGREQYNRVCVQCHGRNLINAGTTVFDLRRFPIDQPRSLQAVGAARQGRHAVVEGIVVERTDRLAVGLRGQPRRQGTLIGSPRSGLAAASPQGATPADRWSRIRGVCLGLCLRFALLLLLAIGVSALRAQSAPLTVCIAEDNEPLSYVRKGEPKGLDVRVAQAIAAEMGRELRIIAVRDRVRAREHAGA